MGKEKDYEVNAASKEIDMLKEDITSLRRTIGGYITCVSKQKREIADLKAQLAIASKPNEDLNNEYEALKVRYEELDKDRGELARTVVRLRDELAQANEKLQATREFLELPWYRRIFA